ncbi:MAG: heme ABC transporter ATP-binding protein [Methylophilaceae bacterium]
MLEVNNVSLSIGHRWLVDGISFNVLPGEVVTICGPNGAGKSSLMRLISGELPPSSGHVSWHGKPIAQWNMLALARHRTLLQQRCDVSFDYTALEVILLGRHPHHLGATRTLDVRIAEAALAEVDASHLAGNIYAMLSGGEQARVQMARVLAQIWEASDTPRLLLLDEPTAALDPRQQHRILSIARAWAQKGDVAVVAIVHDLNLAALYADRIALLRDGRLQIIGSVQTIVTPQTVEACFDLSCTMLEHPDGGPPVMVARRGVGNQ